MLAPFLMTASFAAWADISEPEPRPQLHFGARAFSDETTEARMLIRQKKWAEAVVVLRSGLKKNPNVSSLELDLARALVFSGRREEALTVLSQMMGRKKGEPPKDLIQRSRVLSRIFLTNANFQTHQDGVNLMLAGKYRAARERFDKALEQDAANVEVLTRQSQCLVLEGDFDSAAEKLRLARRLNPYEPDIRLWLGRALHQRGEIREALIELKSAYQELPDSEDAAVWYADALFALGQKAAAIQVLEDDSRRHANHVLGLVMLSRYRILAHTGLRDAQTAWQVRKDLQLALSRLPLYVGASGESTAPAPVVRHLDPMGDLSLDLKKPEAELKREIQKTMEEADARVGSEKSL